MQKKKLFQNLKMRCGAKIFGSGWSQVVTESGRKTAVLAMWERQKKEKKT